MNVIALVLHAVGRVGVIIGIGAGLMFCIWRMLHTLKQGANYVRRLHQIPCSRCAYFTGDYRLKCTVHPVSALTEEAIDCVDYVSSSPRCGKLCSQSAPTYQHIKELVKR
ncbi:hypothetical protein D0962_04560 [Leptolyngbyaceae cyanobacterium CCMR0082]|uniref:Uncharacterized protein n=3 Tax=Adonisia TaxID=2950183 RepID=A0A6M0S2B4_9CYAN|nr:hypothetical protein [Adonisia turfae CCMR0081]NEZ62052.1 hypothetical protein [Adonisia turfae CCMR0082]